MLDKLLLAPMRITVNGEPKQVTAMEAILEQLWVKAMAGEHQALLVYLQCLELGREVVNRRVEIRFASGDYANQPAPQSTIEGSGDE